VFHESCAHGEHDGGEAVGGRYCRLGSSNARIFVPMIRRPASCWKLGKKLLRVDNLMPRRRGAAPRFERTHRWPDVFMKVGKSWNATVLEPMDGWPEILTDGDLRRLMEKHRGAVWRCRAAMP